MARKNPADRIKDLQDQMKKLEQQLKEQEKKRDEELGKIFREEWGIEDSETARLIIDSLKSDVETLIKTLDNKPKTDDTIEENLVSQSS
ncbi:hypothetical protein ACFWMS_23570 [Peribacillus butanolivorans]|uniref:hypothetical protein n=1 Tax=Peribacillus butanolivorans TaxID=421767 RepID=UPI003659FDF6